MSSVERAVKRLKKPAVTVTPYGLDPALARRIEQENILRLLTRWIAKRGYRPSAYEMSATRGWPRPALKRALAHMTELGLVQSIDGFWEPTPAGFALIHAESVSPVLPSNVSARKRHIRIAQMRRATKRLSAEESERLDRVAAIAHVFGKSIQ